MKEGAAYFSWFWRRWIYRNGEREKLDGVVYSLLRNGIAHTFVGKPRVDVTRFAPDLHLSRYDGRLIVDADSLADDFVAACRDFSSNLFLDGTDRTRVERRLEQFEAEIARQSNQHARAIMKAGTAQAPVATRPTAVSSPSIAPVFLSTGGYRPG